MGNARGKAEGGPQTQDGGGRCETQWVCWFGGGGRQAELVG